MDKAGKITPVLFLLFMQEGNEEEKQNEAISA